MPAVAEPRLRELLTPFGVVDGVPHRFPDRLLSQLSTLLDLLLHWNARTNLTAIREPETVVVRHFGESLFAGWCLGSRLSSVPGMRCHEVLDLGSGAGFPGLPIQLLLPEIRVTLAESQGKKAAFLREAVRELGLDTEVWSDRVEAMPATSRFDAVTMRAVDRMAEMRGVGLARLRPGGVLLEMTSGTTALETRIPIPTRADSFVCLTTAE